MNQLTLDGTVVPEPVQREPKRYKRPVEMYGAGPAGATCGTCAYCFRERTWHKCGQWKLTGSTATDIKLSWPACGKWRERAT